MDSSVAALDFDGYLQRDSVMARPLEVQPLYWRASGVQGCAVDVDPRLTDRLACRREALANAALG